MISKEDNGRLLFFRINRNSSTDPIHKSLIGQFFDECKVIKVLLGGYYYVEIAGIDFKGCVNILEVKKALKKGDAINEKMIVKDVNFFDGVLLLSMKKDDLTKDLSNYFNY